VREANATPICANRAHAVAIGLGEILFDFPSDPRAEKRRLADEANQYVGVGDFRGDALSHGCRGVIVGGDFDAGVVVVEICLGRSEFTERFGGGALLGFVAKKNGHSGETSRFCARRSRERIEIDANR